MTDIKQLNIDDLLNSEDAEQEETANRVADELPKELLTLKLLRAAIEKANPGDKVMGDFAVYVLPNLLRIAIGHTAKGGEFFENLDRQGIQVRRDNAADQSLNTHLLNGIFPANLIEQQLEKMDTTVRRVVRAQERRLMLAAFILHDFEKFPDVSDDARKLPLGEQRKIIEIKIQELGLDTFINPGNPTIYREYLDDLLCMAANAQRRWDTNWNFSTYGLQPKISNDKVLRTLSELTCLADSLASIIKHPHDSENARLRDLLHGLSDGQLKFTYHAISENRGVLTNVVNNAVMEAHTALNTDDCKYYKPLLYLPTGVIYLVTKDAPLISVSDIPERVIDNIKNLCAGELNRKQTGFGRDGKGMKYADYYTLFFDDTQLMEVGLSATLRILNPQKDSVAKSRSDNLVRFQQLGVLPADLNFAFADDSRIDQLAEFGDLVTRKIWGEKLLKLQEARKKNKNLPELPHLDIVQEVIKKWELTEYLPAVRAIQRINESLKDNKLTGNTGGVPYEWYFLAARYLQRFPGIDNIRLAAGQLIDLTASLIKPLLAQYSLADGWNDLREWVKTVVMLPIHTNSSTASSQTFLNELSSYLAAKKTGREKQLICSISHSAYTVTEQMESAVLFTPQVYTNKQMLNGSNAKRNISSIAGLEMMLRQILMNQTQAVGKSFEDGKYRYLYFYPTYYFTPETNNFLQLAYNNIAQTRFDTSLKKHFVPENLQANFSQENYQNVGTFLIDENLAAKKALPTTDPNYRRDSAFKLSYPEDKPLTFYFMALPPGRDGTDTESWVMPSWLAFAFPMILDVKTVVSESPIPPFTDGAEFEETVFLDGAPPAIRSLIGKERFRLDQILQPWFAEDNARRPAPLNALTAAYSIHLDVYARLGKSGYDPNWGRLVSIATEIETTPLAVFSLLSQWARKDDVPGPKRIQLYVHHLYPCFDPHAKFNLIAKEFTVSEMSPLHPPRTLTTLYRRFYRAKSTKGKAASSNAVLKPIDEAADLILKADSMYRGEALVDVVAARLFKLMERVHNRTAEGRVPLIQVEEEGKKKWKPALTPEAERQAIHEFAHYFVIEVFGKAFSSDRARLAGRQLGYLRDTCEYLYRLDQDAERQASKDDPADEDEV
ncbi:type I-D CRISPR-associated protein Cas10d/Csc3 [Anthocerotibacter panamensis]|uniref:type I-D CRISPR-associated protein Cas10d/Csc3 n=1 Tax=Anthocerotibacter panamensis TaxID=2857077 RepID=UPI001C406D80|nr:type I-D CRISPR-associated protein Cas10d/Csc3 [Anthocerotibacter panamensis]